MNAIKIMDNNDNTLLAKLKIAAQNGLIRFTDYYFACFIRDFFNKNTQINDEILILACILSHDTALGHVCIDIDKVAAHPLIREMNLYIPDINKLRDILRNNTDIVGDSDKLFKTPLILDNNRLYMSRYWYFETQVADNIKKRVNNKPTFFDIDSLKKYLSDLFPAAKYKPDWQKIAVLVSIINNFSVISGGPGTGKTRTVASLLLLLKKIASDNDRIFKIALCAPTGKATARLTESIKKELARFREHFKDNSSWLQIINDISTEASTIHRLLRYNLNTGAFRHNRENPLDIDALVVDEVSMVDLPLMSRLVTALPLNSKLIFLGDKDQLASVETGSVLGDICSDIEKFNYSEEIQGKIRDIAGEDITKLVQSTYHYTSPIRDSITILSHSHRFSDTSGIGKLSRAINAGNPDEALDILTGNTYNDVLLYEPDATALKNEIKNNFIKKFEPCLKEKDPKRALELFNNFRILCAVREGAFGVVYVNKIIEEILKENGLISKNRRWYAGRPIMILENDYALNLFNGDVGIVLKDEKINDNMAYFVLATTDEIQKYAPVRLPKHESVYAMTIHKSQGSDFNEILVIIPEITSNNQKTTQILTKELLYTAVTRAKSKLTIFGKKQTIIDMAQTRIQRNSGLYEKLWADL